MRGPRIPYDEEISHCHLMDRVAGETGCYPFGDVEKERLLQIHLVCAAPGDLPCREEVMANWRASRSPDAAEPNWDNPEEVAKLAARMRGISSFVKEFEQRFTRWFNRSRSRLRRGGLWADRLRSVLLDKDTALWDCLAYVEMNPVRAKLTESPGDYRFCTWGRMVGGGTHPFTDNLVRRLRHYLGEQAKPWSDGRVVAEPSANMARIAAAERGEDSETVFAALDEAPTGRESFLLTVRRRVRYWTDGAPIGSELSVRDMAAKLIDPKRAAAGGWPRPVPLASPTVRQPSAPIGGFPGSADRRPLSHCPSPVGDIPRAGATACPGRASGAIQRPSDPCLMPHPTA